MTTHSIPEMPLPHVSLDNILPGIAVNAVEANLYAWFQDLAHSLSGQLDISPSLSRFHCAPCAPFFKGVWRARLAPEAVDTAIDETITWFAQFDAPFFLWWVDAESQPHDLGQRLLARGFKKFDTDAPTMVAEIGNLKNKDKPRPAQLRIVPVTEDRQLIDFRQVLVEATQVPVWAGQAWVDAARTIGLGRTPWTMLLAYMDDEPACSGLLYCGAGVAGLQNLATRPKFRRQGIGTAMQWERLRLAENWGCRYAVLYSTKIGYPTYKNLGFQDTGRHISRYIWR